jgi:hypothetical protein
MRSFRTLLILVGRQLADDGPYLIGVIGVAACCLLVLALLAFVYPHGLLLSEIVILGVLPVVIGTALFIFGSAQVHSDHSAQALLSVRSTGLPIFLARLVSGVAFVGIVVIILALAIAGGIADGLIQWPDSFSPGEQIDLFAGLFGVGLACYCLGLMAGQRARTFHGALCSWPLILVMASLIIAKGLGRPLTTILIFLIASSLGYLLIVARHPRLAAIPAAFVVSTLTVVPLYWLRYSSDVATTRAMLAASDKASITCASHEFPLKQEPNSYSESYFVVEGTISAREVPFLQRTGIVSYLQARKSAEQSIDRRFWPGRWRMNYDSQRGCFVCINGLSTLYAGPKAVADTLTEELGRFVSPVICDVQWDTDVVFDEEDSHFYMLDLGKRRVRRGPYVAPGTLQHVMGITSTPDLGNCWVSGYYPSARDRDRLYVMADGDVYVPIIDESGAVAALDLRTGDLIVGVGHLPAPHSPFGCGSPRPRDLFNYDVKVIAERPEMEYAGLMAATLSRQGVPVTVAVFDRDGRLIREDSSTVAIPPWLTTKYLVESLHPPVLTLASFFMAYSFDAGATHRTIFLMPNSFVAQQRDRQTSLFFQLLWALLFMVPAILFAGFLSWRVGADARVFGLSGWARWTWMMATLAFGLPAYITYRLMRPKCVLMVCTGCGQSRRVDSEVCHHCGRGWESLELEPPAWRVVGHHVRQD